MGVKIETKSVNVSQSIPMLDLKNNEIGQLRSAAYSPKFNKVVGIAMVKKDFCNISEKFEIKFNNNKISGEICNLPIL